jgi:hypothetical protein
MQVQRHIGNAGASLKATRREAVCKRTASYTDKGADDKQMHEHQRRETQQGCKPNIIQCQQRESTAQEYEHAH